ncbi:unnamed protein product [Notodromas monacha]|uniref:PIPK domain-containing protein n=1 Tax=Notodromas monacha TaxID=399045 RepID=A0A7R9BM24_9CRUS|nr:unnamed protein product [Notodromas monacha]CAG0916506.1 unnamed protein product [Notodromas monacha]
MAAVSTASAAESFPVRENSTAINLDDTIEGEDVNGSPKAKLEAADSNVSSGTLRASGGAAGAAAKKTDKEKKIGHRRVDEEGQITYKKIQTSQIMSSIQLGIAHAVGSLASKPERDLLMQDFAVVETVYFAKEGSQHTPAHHNQDFRFKIYAPMAFRYFRDLFGIQPDDFLVSMCDSPLKELSNAGASGSIFYLTIDDEFIVKTVQHKEAEFLQKLLPGYYMNLNQNPRTLLPKFFGLYCYQCNSKNVRLIVMNNLLPSSIRYHQKYDLKGSTYKRKANKYERNKKSPTYKDLDFIEHHTEGLMLEAETYCALMKTIQRDCRVLESFKIMDYSLLVGIHNLDQAAKERALRHSPSPMTENPGNDGLKMQKRPGAGDSSSAVVDTEPYPSHSAAGQQQQHHYHHHRDGPVSLDVPSAMNASYFGGGGGAKSGPALTRSKSLNRQRLVAHSTAMESIQAQSEPIDEDDNVPPGGIPARNAQGERLLVFLGIIDILQSYRLKKRLEHTFKSVIHDGDSVSVHNPTFYSERFRSFMEKKVFKKIPSLDLPEITGKHRKFRTLVSSYIALKHSPSKKKTAAAVKLKPSEFEHGEAESAGNPSGGGGGFGGNGAGAAPKAVAPAAAVTAFDGADTLSDAGAGAAAAGATAAASVTMTAAAPSPDPGTVSPSDVTPVVHWPSVLRDRPRVSRGPPPPVPPRGSGTSPVPPVRQNAPGAASGGGGGKSVGMNTISIPEVAMKPSPVSSVPMLA